MYFDNWNDFLAMGGHGLYVWLAYGVTTVTILTWIFAQRQRRAKLLVELRLRAQRNEQGA